MRILLKIYILCSFLFILRYIINMGSDSRRTKQIDLFIHTKEYIKKSLYSIVTKIQKNKIKTHVSANLEKIQLVEKEINLLATGVACKLYNFIRKDDVVKDVQESLNPQEDMNIFLFPDTLLIKSNICYYKKLLDLSKILTEYDLRNKEEELTETNAKLILESLV